MRQVFFVFLLLVTVAGLIPAQAQSAPESWHNRCQLWGQVISADYPTADGMEVELAGNSHVPRQRAPIIDGGFDLQPVPAGVYQFRILDRAGHVLLRSTQSLSGSNDGVILRFPYAFPETSSVNVVSVAQLSHSTSGPAVDAFRNGLKAVDAGDVQKGIEYFQKAVTLDSLYVEAENNLAVLDIGLGRIEEALQHAQRAYQIQPEWAETGYTLAVLLIVSKDYVQVEQLARTMLANHQAVSKMHAFLAVGLIGQRRNFDEAYGHLRLAAEDFPMARLLAANALVEIGLPTVAAVQVNGYLQTAAHDCERAKLERWMANADRSESKLARSPPEQVDNRSSANRGDADSDLR